MIIKGSIKFSVLFEGPFWVGIFESISENGYSAARTVFGAEPTDQEVFQFLLTEYDQLRFTTPNSDEPVIKICKNPKRQLREVRQALQKKITVSAAQEALRIELEKNKLISKKRTVEQKRLEEEHQFHLKQEKKKKKLRGH